MAINDRGAVQGDDELPSSLNISHIETRIKTTKVSRFKLETLFTSYDE